MLEVARQKNTWIKTAYKSQDSLFRPIHVFIIHYFLTSIGDEKYDPEVFRGIQSVS